MMMKFLHFWLTIFIVPINVFPKPFDDVCPFGGRCLPNQPCWPSLEQWNSLNESVHGRLSIPQLTIQPCLEDINYDDAACQRSLENLGKDPFYLQQFPAGFESTGIN